MLKQSCDLCARFVRVQARGTGELDLWGCFEAEFDIFVS